ncbi:MAG: ATP-dependent zinc metalloprotease FtsH [Verrucomicrobia subdivision 3 bacterium]|nr:ATP-dependent zinc metalloprotease FtsH [Limisphaerales bacterium]MCS1415641.1 ATP-dependent zinc metalloprotease FtsH [Limisphaerales bacterium]
MKPHTYGFLKEAGRVINSGQARTLAFTGNIYDLFCAVESDREEYVHLVDYLTTSWNLLGIIVVVYELNGPIRFLNDTDAHKIRDAWLRWRSGYDSNELAIKRLTVKGKVAADLDHIISAYDDSLRKAVNNPTLALELLRQMCLCSRTEIDSQPILSERLIVLVESADMVIPEAPIVNLSDKDRQRVSICHDWFSDPGFVTGEDTVILIAESRSQLHHRVSTLPHLLEVEVPAPDLAVRKHFISWFNRTQLEDRKIKLWGSQENLAQFTAGLSLHALMQLLKGAAHENKTLVQEAVIAKVETYIQSQLGEDVVEFKKPKHGFKNIVGFHQLKSFLQSELIPRFAASGEEALAGAAVAGPIGGGKTFIFEAVAAELDMVVLVIKNIRSQWFGQTDVIFERLRRVLNVLSKVLIFIDEADTQLGGVGADAHPTERRLTGRIQSMMSDPQMRGRVVWLLVTARIHLLSPDLRRPGRAGDLIIPVLDPEGDDIDAFLTWVVKPVLGKKPNADQLKSLKDATPSYSAASYASLRSELKAKALHSEGCLSFEMILEIISDHIPPAIGATRRYQTLQALVNCTRRSLLPEDAKGESDLRDRWESELLQLESQGIR